MDKIERALMAVAKQNGISIDEVIKEIQKAIDLCMSNLDSNVQAFWNSVPRKGNRPTVQELILYIINQDMA